MVKPGQASRRFFYQENALGSTLGVSDASAAASSRYEYDAFGFTYTLLAGQNTPHRFAGKHGYYSDDDSGMQLLGLRYYLPTVGRFLTQDPKGHDAGLNLYEYCGNNPLTMVDPNGQYAIVIHGKNNPNQINIIIPIQFRTPRNFRPREVGAIIGSIERTWSGQFGPYQVTTKVWDVDLMKKKPALYNEVWIHPGYRMSECYGWLHRPGGDFWYGDWYVGNPSYLSVVAHEAGHLMELDDQYQDNLLGRWWNNLWGRRRKTTIPPEWEGNIMADALHGSVDQRNIEQILRRN